MGEMVTEEVLSLVNGELSTQPSTVSSEIGADSKQITTVIIFVISAIIAITLLFMVAVFIDCRQQKLQKLKSKPKRKILKFKLPLPVVGLPAREDRNPIIDKIEYDEPPDGVLA